MSSFVIASTRIPLCSLLEDFRVLPTVRPLVLRFTLWRTSICAPATRKSTAVPELSSRMPAPAGVPLGCNGAQQTGRAQLASCIHVHAWIEASGWGAREENRQNRAASPTRVEKRWARKVVSVTRLDQGRVSKINKLSSERQRSTARAIVNKLPVSNTECGRCPLSG